MFLIDIEFITLVNEFHNPQSFVSKIILNKSNFFVTQEVHRFETKNVFQENRQSMLITHQSFY